MREFIVATLEKLCALLDTVPRYTEGRWWRYGDWGCTMGLSKLSAHLEQRWETGYWSS